MENTQNGNRILIVDDDRDIRAVMSLLLKKNNYHVEEASSGEEAIDHLDKTDYDLVLLDINMPIMNGFDICKEIKSNPKTERIPVIFLTSSMDTKNKVSAFEDGAADYITKTFKKEELLARIKTQLRLSSLVNELELANKKLKESEQELKEDLVAAANIQNNLLPKSFNLPSTIEIYSKFLPSNIVAGDLFNYISIDEDNIAIYILDVSGHGVSSAMVTVSIYQTLHSDKDLIFESTTNNNKTYSPGKILGKLNKEYPLERFGKYFTINLIILNHKTGELKYSSAGHPPPFLITEEKEIIALDKGGTITGFDMNEEFEEGTVILNKGDKVLLYTDGLIDHSEQDTDGIQRLKENIETVKDQSLSEMIESITKKMISEPYIKDLEDDVSIFAFEYNKRG